MTDDQDFDAPDDDWDDDYFIQDGPGLFDEPLPPAEPACDIAANDGVLLNATEDAAELPEPAAPEAVERPVVEPAAEDSENLALYRRYRPDTFDDVIGQDHVTKPLMQAIDNGRVNHAYLFSGPRGCGKTTSARILARCLNCAQGPTSRPCGVCESCVALATGGPGSIDVIEIDAASHGRVDDARELRDGVYFAPVMSRYKIYVIDEAHMVTKEGFNALLKVVEEPPAHVKFIFATTEPDKVIGTIRSRTHHYPFRLVPPRELTDYLAKICSAEQIEPEQGVLSLVVRAGSGSVRDSMSVLDQLLGAADNGVVRYSDAVGLLGYTPDSLLDEMVDAFAAGDGHGVFSAIDKVISGGQDPRRFAEDVLQRLRDLVIVSQVPDAFASRLIDVPADQAERLAQQAAAMGPGELTRAAEVIAEGITHMRGTTAPRLHLELLCSRVLLPQADMDGRGLHARVERLERRLDMPSVAGDDSDTSGAAPNRLAVDAVSEPAPQQPEPARQRPAPSRNVAEEPVAQPGSERQRPAGPPATDSVQEPPRQRPATQRPAEHRSAEQHPGGQRPGGQLPAGQRPAPQPKPAPPSVPAQPAGEVSTADVRRLWPQILDEVRSRKRFSHALISQEATVLEVSGKQLRLGFSTQGIADNFSRGGSSDVLRDSIVQVMGADLVIVPVVGEAPTQQPQPEERQQRSTARSAPPEMAEPEPSGMDDGISEDDEILDESGEDITQMLAREFDAEIIDVEDN